jgi:hypothetical protein
MGVSQLFLALTSLLIIISLVANFGYVLNELSDVDEDARVKRLNITAFAGAARLWTIAVICVVGSLSLAWYWIGWTGLILTAGVLLFPIAYSVRPVRLKERKWFGILADTCAAHVYPVLLCVMVGSQTQEQISGTLFVVLLLWSFMLGLRGILVHQLVDEELDRAGGLRTVIHDHGRNAVIGLVKYLVAPIEIFCLLITVLLSCAGPVFYILSCIYIAYEISKIWAGWHLVLFSRTEAPYVPFLNNGFYEVWGPIAASFDAATHHAALLALPLMFVVLFWSRVITELKMIGALSRDTVRLATAWGRRARR